MELFAQWLINLVKVLSFRLQQCVDPFATLSVSGSSETWLFRHLSNHILRSPYFQKHVSYGDHRFQKCKKKIQKKFFFLEIIVSELFALIVSSKEIMLVIDCQCVNKQRYGFVYHEKRIFPMQLPPQWLINIVKVLLFRLQQCFTHLACCLSKSPLKHGFLYIYLTVLFGAGISRTTSATRVIFR